MRFVEDPSADLALGNRPAKGLVAKLLGRDQQNAHISQLNLLQHLGPFGHGQQAVQGRSALDVASE
ncbi:hypothetical protein D9M70_610620 [compost metagenome]